MSKAHDFIWPQTAHKSCRESGGCRLQHQNLRLQAWRTSSELHNTSMRQSQRMFIPLAFSQRKLTAPAGVVTDRPECPLLAYTTNACHGKVACHPVYHKHRIRQFCFKALCLDVAAVFFCHLAGESCHPAQDMTATMSGCTRCEKRVLRLRRVETDIAGKLGGTRTTAGLRTAACWTRKVSALGRILTDPNLINLNIFAESLHIL